MVFVPPYQSLLKPWEQIKYNLTTTIRAIGQVESDVQKPDNKGKNQTKLFDPANRGQLYSAK